MKDLNVPKSKVCPPDIHIRIFHFPAIYFSILMYIPKNHQQNEDIIPDLWTVEGTSTA
jgi:hypothetical protein